MAVKKSNIEIGDIVEHYQLPGHHGVVVSFDDSTYNQVRVCVDWEDYEEEHWKTAAVRASHWEHTLRLVYSTRFSTRHQPKLWL